jgi:hypothetical protein
MWKIPNWTIFGLTIGAELMCHQPNVPDCLDLCKLDARNSTALFFASPPRFGASFLPLKMIPSAHGAMRDF